jgi:hypothetical protein
LFPLDFRLVELGRRIRFGENDTRRTFIMLIHVLELLTAF